MKLTATLAAFAIGAVLLTACTPGSSPSATPTTPAVVISPTAASSGNACAGATGKLAFRLRATASGVDEVRVLDIATGDETKVAELAAPRAVQPQAWSKQGALAFLTYVAPGDETTAVFLRQPDGVVRELSKGRGGAWSPDGERLLLLVRREQGVGLVAAILNPADGSMQRIGINGAGPETGVGAAAWDPSGKKIAFIAYDPSVPDGGGDFLVVHDIESGAQQRIAISPQVGKTPEWSPDGTRVLLVNRRAAVVDLRSSAVQDIGRAINAAWSPAADEIVVTGVGEQPEVARVIDPKGVTLRNVSIGVILGEGPAGVAWSPDGKCVAISSDDGISLWEPATGRTRLLTKARAGGELAWSP